MSFSLTNLRITLTDEEILEDLFYPGPTDTFGEAR
jgi:hypothetical protein